MRFALHVHPESKFIYIAEYTLVILSVRLVYIALFAS